MTLNEIIMQLVLLEEHPAMSKGFQPTFQKVIEAISEMPEIIRCKDCKWWDKQEMSLQGRCGLFQMYPTGEWYCGNAKLRGDSE